MSRLTRRSLWLLIPGLAVVLGSYLAVELFPDTWGGPNIGAGFVLLLGYLAVAAGVIGLVFAYRNRSE